MDRRALALTAVLCGACATTRAPAPALVPRAPVKRAVFVVPVGPEADALVDLVVRDVRALDVQATPAVGVDLDARLEDHARHAFAAEDLIDAMKRGERDLVEGAGTIVIGVTAVDMYPRARPSWPFAFGWDAENRYVLVSTAHLDPARTGGPPDPALLARRVRKVVWRKLGVLYFRLPTPKESSGLMRRSVDGVETLDALPDGFTEEDVPPPWR